MSNDRWIAGRLGSVWDFRHALQRLESYLALWSARWQLAPACFMESGSTNITSTAATVALATVAVEHANYYLESNAIVIATPGRYHIDYSVPVNDDSAAGDTHNKVYCFVELDPSDGYAVIPQSRGQDHAREDSGGEGVNGGFICEIPLPSKTRPKIRLRIQQSGTTDISTETGQAQLSIMKVG
jgi:hypothetical protein